MPGEKRRAKLIEAGLACMARGGITEFTVDRICAEAGVSRGLITHYFGTMSALLRAVYVKMYEGIDMPSGAIRADATHLSLFLDAQFSPEAFNKDSVNVWLALWGQIATDDDLRAEHQAQYATYLARIAAAITDAARRNGRTVDAMMLAKTLVPLMDGLYVQHGIDPDSMPAGTAQAACRTLLEPHLGPF